jgi:hypothetical protein
MNMFRNLLTLAFIGLGFGLVLSNPLDWKWVAACGPYVVYTASFLTDARPISTILCFVLALALWMTRKQY